MSTGTLFPKGRVQVVAMVHVGALPGTPKATKSLDEIIDRAGAEAAAFRDAGVDAILAENMHDLPYTRREVGPEITAAMTRVGLRVREASGLPVGLQILAGANREALAAAFSAGCQFIRVLTPQFY